MVTARSPDAGENERMHRIALDLYLLEGISWPELGPDSSEGLRNALERLRFRGTSPERYGFTRVSGWRQHVVYGYFSQEFMATIREYDDRKVAKERILPNFVELQFLIRTDLGLLLLQDRKFNRQEEGNLSMTASRQRFERILSDTVGRLGWGSMKLVPKEEVHVPKEQFLEVIRREEVLELEVDQLAEQRIPDDIVVFNPDVDRERIWREVWNSYESPNLGKITLRAAPGGDLGRSKVAKSSAHAGQPKKVRYKTRPNRMERTLVRVRKTHIGGVRRSRRVSCCDLPGQRSVNASSGSSSKSSSPPP